MSNREEHFFVISVAAELAGMHAQTLRQYDRLGLVTPARAHGGGRRYSDEDVELLREIQHLSQDDRAEVLKTWRDWGNIPTSPSRDYQVAVCHIIGGQPRITTTITIPRR